MMREGFDLPPLMFTRDEIVALVAGAPHGQGLRRRHHGPRREEALVKIGAASCPTPRRTASARTEIHAPMWVVSDADRAHIDRIERAVEKREVLTLGLSATRPAGPPARDVRPLWSGGSGARCGRSVAWCEMRSRFSRLPHRPHRLRHRDRPHLQAGARQAARRLLPLDGTRRTRRRHARPRQRNIDQPRRRFTRIPESVMLGA